MPSWTVLRTLGCALSLAANAALSFLYMQMPITELQATNCGTPKPSDGTPKPSDMPTAKDQEELGNAPADSSTRESLPTQSFAEPQAGAVSGEEAEVTSLKEALKAQKKLFKNLDKKYGETKERQKEAERTLAHVKAAFLDLESSYQILQKTKKDVVAEPRAKLKNAPVSTEELFTSRSNAVLPASAHKDPGKYFDISVNAFKRDFELQYSLEQYLKCQKGGTPIATIHVVWNDYSRPPPGKLKRLLKSDEGQGIQFFIPPVMGRSKAAPISTRYWPLNYTSSAVFHVDDDVPHMCETLQLMFDIWRTDVDGMVGTSPRRMDLTAGGMEAWFEPLIKGEYNIVFLTKGAFVHRRFFDEYWKDVWKPMRHVVDKFNCAEDVLFSAMHLTLVGSNHVYSIGGTVNHGRTMLLEGYSFYSQLNRVESHIGLNARTWKVRGDAVTQIANFLMKTFREKFQQGLYSRFQRKFWRSRMHPDLSCRLAPVPCFNRAWNSCWRDCDVPVRGDGLCFTGDSACYAGMGLSLRKDISENMILLCTSGGQCFGG